MNEITRLIEKELGQPLDEAAIKFIRDLFTIGFYSGYQGHLERSRGKKQVQFSARKNATVMSATISAPNGQSITVTKDQLEHVIDMDLAKQNRRAEKIIAGLKKFFEGE